MFSRRPFGPSSRPPAPRAPPPPRTSTTSPPAWKNGAMNIRPSVMGAASMPATRTATASARSTSTPPKASGRCCAPGSGRTVASRRRSCPPISASSSSSTTPAAAARPYSPPSSPAWSPRPCLTPPKPDKSLELYGRSKQAWLETFLALPNGIPSHDTFRRVFMLIDPDAFEGCFSRWVQAWARGFKREVVAVDGKTVRRSGSRRHDHGPLHVVSAWASDQGLALGQRAVDGKSNEIMAIPELLETLHLEGCIVTLDAMGCQKDIAAQIRAKGADYLLVLKANHGRAFGAVREQFERTCFGRGCKRRPVFDAFDEGHGRLTVAWSVGASSWPWRSRTSSPCTAGLTCVRFSQSRRSGASTAPARSRPRSAIS